MGTSSSYSAPTSGSWPVAKRTATRFARQGGTGTVGPGQLMRAYVAALGGAATAAMGAAAAQESARRLAGFLSSVAGQGLVPTLQREGLAALAGRDTTEVLAELVDRLAGAGQTLEDAVAREAMRVVLADEFGEADTIAELDALCTERLDAGGVVRLLERFLVEYVYQRMLEQIGDRLQNGAATVEGACRLEEDLRAFIVATVKLEFALADPLALDWDGSDAQELVQRLLENAYGELEAERV